MSENWADELTVVEQIRKSAKDTYKDWSIRGGRVQMDRKLFDQALRHALIRLDMSVDEAPKWEAVFEEAMHEAAVGSACCCGCCALMPAPPERCPHRD